MVLPRFLAELKHRNVYRAAVVYAAVGWMLLEAADVVFPRLGLPDWTVNLVLGLVLLGFPLAIVFAWIFDISTQGIVRTEPIPPHARHHFNLPAIVEFVLICVLVVTVGYLYVDRLSLQKGMSELEYAVQEKPEPSQPAVPNPEQYRAIAVLPFADMSEAGDQAWFAEGIAEELLHALAGVEGLQVMARTSSFAFKGTEKTIAQIADILGVQAVLEGSVRRSGDRVRITAQLVDAGSGYHLWSNSYERELRDIFKLQDELAKSIVGALRLKLKVEHPERLVAEHTGSMEAYNWFIRGRSLYDWANWKTHKQSIHYFQQAVQADPQYAIAWGYLANALSLSVLWQSIDGAFAAAQSAYERALALDPEQSQALSAKALRLALYDHDWAAAVDLYQRAMKSRDNTVAEIGYGAFITHAADRPDLTVRMYLEAEKRDPLHAGIKANLGTFLVYVGDTEAAIEKAKESLKLQPDHIFAFIALMDAYTARGQYDEVKATIGRIPRDLVQNPNLLVRVGLYYAAVGKNEKAFEIYRGMVEHPSPAPIVNVSSLALALGLEAEALDYMELMVEERSWTIPWIRTHYRHNSTVKDHPRYLAILKRIGLDDESVAALNNRMSLTRYPD